ncbi:methyltransferase family protein [Kineococcus xinjiangensis]|uniref:Methyltransferase family protein n=1 Tax=Kineococcus xinjiangensis TaxID=512762 RepID=A0A2S6IDH1_9ACTN|nr:class I SAM-dependent methyltransferase [Kineococcus xinjiangensis]PPK92265.1 methyltransferase family protein [Kineococcus xinjiangensis]
MADEERSRRSRWLAETGGARGAEYAARIEAHEAGGGGHGEADFVHALLPGPSRIVDAGCGEGRVARALRRLGHRVVGVDSDASMIAEARRREPGAVWVESDLLEVTGERLRDALGGEVDAVVAAGNVLVYVAPGTEGDVVARCAGWLRPGGLLVAGFAADRHLTPGDYAATCAAAALEPVAEHGGWDGEPPSPRRPDGRAPYTVQVHRRPAAGTAHPA